MQCGSYRSTCPHTGSRHKPMKNIMNYQSCCFLKKLSSPQIHLTPPTPQPLLKTSAPIPPAVYPTISKRYCLMWWKECTVLFGAILNSLFTSRKMSEDTQRVYRTIIYSLIYKNLMHTFVHRRNSKKKQRSDKRIDMMGLEKVRKRSRLQLKACYSSEMSAGEPPWRRWKRRPPWRQLHIAPPGGDLMHHTFKKERCTIWPPYFDLLQPGGASVRCHS